MRYRKLVVLVSCSLSMVSLGIVTTSLYFHRGWIGANLLFCAILCVIALVNTWRSYCLSSNKWKGAILGFFLAYPLLWIYVASAYLFASCKLNGWTATILGIVAVLVSWFTCAKSKIKQKAQTGT
jgi:hypothetical protein